MYKCSGSIVVQGDGDFELLTSERVAYDAYAALDLVLSHLMKQLSMQEPPAQRGTLEWNLLAWVDPVVTSDQVSLLTAQQRERDAAVEIK